jgi:predicted metal-dependent phosphoesterase TrpH
VLISPPSDRPLFKADLHVHSRHSRFPHFRKLGLRSSYSDPIDLYHTARARGMDLVTITDHGTIDGCLEVLDRLGERPDFMISEEVETGHPDLGEKIHLNVFDIDEIQHRDIHKLRGDFQELAGYLRRERILASFNHFIDTFALTPPPESVLHEVLSRFDLFEVRDGARPASYNRVMERILWEATQGGVAKGFIGGSNAHTLRRVGTTYTASPARNRQEFLDDLRQGRTLPFGRDGTTWSLAADVYGVLWRYYLNLVPGFDPGLRWRQRALGWMMSVLTFPLHLPGFPILVSRLHMRRVHDRLSRIQRRLDRMDVLKFRERVHRVGPPLRPAGEWPENGASRGPVPPS